MAILTGPQQAFIVTCLACFERPADVVDAVRETFGVTVTRQQVWTYDASQPGQRERLARKLVALFDATRRQYLEDTASIPIANKAYRLNRLQKLLERAEGMGAVTLAKDLLEQGAKEMGEVYTNRHKVEHAGEVRKVLIGVDIDEI